MWVSVIWVFTVRALNWLYTISYVMAKQKHHWAMCVVLSRNISLLVVRRVLP